MYQKREQGVALLYVLGILALLIVMALAFMNSSIFDQRAISHSSAGGMAERLALSTMEQVFWAIQDGNYFNDDTKEYFYSYMPKDHYGSSFNDNDVPQDKLSALDTYEIVGTKKIHSFKWDDFADKDKIRWILHRLAIGGTASNIIYRVIGRSAYILYPLGTSQLDPSSLVDPDIDEATSGSNKEKRRGVEISEINIGSIKKPFESSSVFSNYISKFNWPVQPGGLCPVSPPAFPGGWPSANQLRTDLNPSLAQLEEITKSIDTYFVFDSVREREEKYTMNCVDGTGTVVGKIELHRFYLPRFNDQKITDSYGADYKRRKRVYTTGNFWDDTTNFDLNRDILLRKSGTPDTQQYIDYVLDDPTGPNGRPGTLYSNTPTLPDSIDYASASDIESLGTGIQWLANFGFDKDGVVDDTLKGSFDELVHRRQQIAANLKDYCDSDNEPTSNKDASTWEVLLTDEANAPKYTGNEKTPYLNEFQVKLVLNNTMTIDEIDHAPAAPGYKLRTETEVDLVIGGESVYIYGEPVATHTIKVNAVIPSGFSKDIEIKFNGDSQTTGTQPLSLLPGLRTITAAEDSSKEKNHYFGDCGSIIDPSIHLSGSLDVTSSEFTNIDNLPESVIISLNFEIWVGDALLSIGTDNVDYAKLRKKLRFHKDIEFKRTIGAKGDSETLSRTYIVSIQTEDPRQNLNSKDWQIVPAGSLSITGAGETEVGELDVGTEQPTSYLGSVNLKSNPSSPNFDNSWDDATGSDPERATDPAYQGTAIDKHLSTAYIRNAPMLSPWELGFIHRGHKWQTLNLSAYNKDKANKAYEHSNGTVNVWFQPGGGRYSEGDANILNQIKMTPEVKSPVKVNVAGASEQILNALFQHVQLGCSPILKGSSIDNITTTGTEIDTSFISAIIGKFGNAKFTTRAEMADILSYESRTELDSDPLNVRKAEREELIGKVINLTDVYSGMQLFDLIILSQAIQDVGDPANKTNSIAVKKSYYDVNNDIKTTDPINAYIGELNWDHTAGVIADEITAQRKLRVRGFRKPTGEVQLINIKTLE